jgi:hypothetical protein
MWKVFVGVKLREVEPWFDSAASLGKRATSQVMRSPKQFSSEEAFVLMCPRRASTKCDQSLPSL